MRGLHGANIMVLRAGSQNFGCGTDFMTGLGQAAGYFLGDVLVHEGGH